MIDVKQTIISQFANSPTIRALIKDMDQWIDPRADLRTFYDYVWNVETAQGFGLDIWGKIVGIGREIAVEDELEYFGFNTGVADSQPFNNAPFWFGHPSTTTFRLTDGAYRKLILLKALANISATDAASLNRLLSKVFDGRPVYVSEIAPMEIRFNFEFHLTPYERSLMRLDAIVPRPAGVGYSWREAPPSEIFGFAGSNLQPFDQGTF